jgi:hypothetical protein
VADLAEAIVEDDTCLAVGRVDSVTRRVGRGHKGHQPFVGDVTHPLCVGARLGAECERKCNSDGRDRCFDLWLRLDLLPVEAAAIPRRPVSRARWASRSAVSKEDRALARTVSRSRKATELDGAMARGRAAPSRSLLGREIRSYSLHQKPHRRRRTRARRFQAVFVREPDNPYDSNAIAVYPPAGKTGT